MTANTFTSKYFEVENSKKLAILAVGYRAKISTYQNAINILTKHGFSVVAYEYGHHFLTNGNPDSLLKLVDAINEDVISRIGQYEEAITVGASVGAGLCIELSRKINKISYGIYAVAGVSPAENIFEAPLFYFVRKKFTKKGVSRDELIKHWEEIDLSPVNPPRLDSPFLIVLGERDKIVRKDKALATLTSWQKQGLPIIIKSRKTGHALTISWFIKNFESLLAEADTSFA